MASVASNNLFNLLDNEAEDVNITFEEKNDTKETLVVQKKVDRSRASRTEARIRHEYPQRGGYKATAPTRTEDARAGGPRDRNVGPRLSGRRDRDEGGGGGNGSGGGGDYPSRNSRGARTGERTRGSGGGGGGRGTRGRGREFDRHSGTGRHDSEKKETQGWGNATKVWDNAAGEPDQSNTGDAGERNALWQEQETADKNTWGSGDLGADANTSNWDSSKGGGESTDWKAGEIVELSNNADGNATAEGDGNANKQEGTGAAETSPPVAEEVVKTLDEYLAEKAQKTLDIALPEARKPNEGVDDTQWKDAVPLQKEEEEDFLFTGKEQSIRLKSKKTKAKNVLEIDQTFIERPGGGFPRIRGRGRGGRGSRGGREGGDNSRDRREHYRDDRRETRNESWGSENRRGGGRNGGVDIDDANAFPSLGSS